MPNAAGLYEYNKECFCHTIERAYREGRLERFENEYRLVNIEGRLEWRLDVERGVYLGVKAGRDKSNQRAYVCMTLDDGSHYMLASYWAKLACDYLFEGKGGYGKFKLGVLDSFGNVKRGVINHVNGDPSKCDTDNLEVTTDSLNNAHGRLMSEIHHYFPQLVSREQDCQGNSIHKYKGKAISCADIEGWNQTHKLQIKGYRGYKGEFSPRYTREEIASILKYFGLI